MFSVVESSFSNTGNVLFQSTLPPRQQTFTRLKSGQLIHRKRASLSGKRRVNRNTIKSSMEDDSWMPRILENEDAQFTLHSAVWFETGRNEVVIAISKWRISQCSGRKDFIWKPQPTWARTLSKAATQDIKANLVTTKSHVPIFSLFSLSLMPLLQSKLFARIWLPGMFSMIIISKIKNRNLQHSPRFMFSQEWRREMGWGDNAKGHFGGKVWARETAAGVRIERAGLPKTLPNTPFMLSFMICQHIWLDHRHQLAVSTKWIMDIRREKSARGSGNCKGAQSSGLSSERFMVHSDQQCIYPPCFRTPSSITTMIKYPTQHSPS